MKRLINIRMPLLIAVAFVLGIFSCYEFLFGNFYFGLAVLIILIAACVFYVIMQHGVRKRTYFTWKTFLFILIFAILGFGVAHLNSVVIKSREVYGEAVTLTGRVCDYGQNSDEHSTIYYLEDCVNTESGEKYSGKVRIRYSGQLQTGDVLTVTGNLHSTYPIQGEVNTFYLRHSINYELQDVTVLSRKNGELKLDEKVRKYIYNVTQDYMPQNSGVMYALLTGDRTAMDDAVNWSFSRAGIAHLLAVSGLHVGFVVAVVGFALSKLRLHPLLECAILAVPLTFYAYICNFTPSVVRAIVMVVCSYAARACLGKYDLLTSLSLAALIILLVQPFYIFDVGFQLSFLSVFGIATLYAPIDRYLSKKNTNKYLRRFVDAVAISASCTLATFFAVAVNYKEVSVLGIFVNIIAIPLVSVVFVLGMFGLIPWVFHYLLTGADAILQLVVRSAQTVARLDFAAVAVTALSISVLIAIVLMFAIGGFVNLNRLGKRIFYPMCVLLLILSIVLAYVPKQSRNEAYVSFGYDKAVVAVISNDRQGAIIGDFDDSSAVYSAVQYLRQYNLQSCKIFVANYADATALTVMLAVEHLPIDRVYVLTTQINAPITKKLEQHGIEITYQFPNTVIGSSIKVQTVYDGALVAVKVSVAEIDICAVYGEVQSTSVFNAILGADIYVLQGASEQYSSAQLTSLTPYQSSLDYNYGANKYGNFTIRQKGDNISIYFR